MDSASTDPSIGMENTSLIFLNVSWFNNSMPDIYDNITANCSEVLCNTTNLTLGEQESKNSAKKDTLMSDRVREIIIIINMAILCQAISACGIFANIVNIIVFVKQGFKDAVNVTLTGLAVADLGISIFASWLSLCYNPLFIGLDLPFSPLQIVYLTGGLPRLSLARISSWILAFASFERCLCITFPLTFKSIITPKRSLIYIVVVFVVMFASVTPTYYTSRLVEKFDNSKNKTYIGLSFTADRFDIDNIAFGVGVFLSVASFLGVSICTIVLVFSLHKKAKWRDTSAEAVVGSHPGSAATAVSYRNKKVGKMVSLICTIFIVCFIPNTVNQLVMSMVPEFTKNGQYTNTQQVTWSIGFVTEAVNASINIFMYLHMSSRFKSTLRAMLWGSKKKQQQYNGTESELKSSSNNTNGI